VSSAAARARFGPVAARCRDGMVGRFRVGGGYPVAVGLVGELLTEEGRPEFSLSSIWTEHGQRWCAPDSC